MAGTVASVVTETYAGRTTEGHKIYNIKAEMVSAATENITTITVSRLREIIGTPGLVIGGNDAAALRYPTVLTVVGNLITITINADLSGVETITFLGNVVGR